jgi:hypothetical protein
MQRCNYGQRQEALSREHKALSSREWSVGTVMLSPVQVRGTLQQGYPKGRPLSIAGRSVFARRSTPSCPGPDTRRHG